MKNPKAVALGSEVGGGVMGAWRDALRRQGFLCTAFEQPLEPAT